MDLTYRPLVAADVRACLELIQGHLAYPADVLDDIARAWRRLLRDEALHGAVVEMMDARGAAVIVGFGASVFVTSAWAAHARSGDEPYLSVRTLQQELDGRPSILRPLDIARANDTTGLRVLILHYGESRGLPPEARPPLRYLVFEAFIHMLRGYRINEVVQELWDELDQEFIVRGWGRVFTDYRAWFAGRGEPVPPPGQGPLLIGITREECLADPGALAAPIFIDARARISFTRAEQRLLVEALTGKADHELSRALRLALPTVKSRWRAIYERVEQLAPEILPADSGAGGAAGRGQEKRRHLLEYLRRHPEELCPALARNRSSPSGEPRTPGS